ncbi:uncharacterized protein PHALS_15405 [Plasmopara halstedii]|uniref:Uncharacterized protein n=1 Tax=Plasmopara halstedii TaxID=4781 RepID=A0A0P1AGG6_PLAHL|nr:uncharacterized protein PHALS_15405 [Plasmopara halstedii]CEG39838.1 hypothetical protein PHALS_15405 [Plasmopara halstedii]|eukprot:XP_024576207.1 hypothetical protein PHALS_15405 [Plasmopara halstedii]
MKRSKIDPHHSFVSTLETSGDEEYYLTKDQNIPTILHRNLGEIKNSVAYVGRTGFIVFHGHKFYDASDMELVM